MQLLTVPVYAGWSLAQPSKRVGVRGRRQCGRFPVVLVRSPVCSDQPAHATGLAHSPRGLQVDQAGQSVRWLCVNSDRCGHLFRVCHDRPELQPSNILVVLVPVDVHLSTSPHRSIRGSCVADFQLRQNCPYAAKSAHCSVARHVLQPG